MRDTSRSQVLLGVCILTGPSVLKAHSLVDNFTLNPIRNHSMCSSGTSLFSSHTYVYCIANATHQTPDHISGVVEGECGEKTKTKTCQLNGLHHIRVIVNSVAPQKSDFLDLRIRYYTS